ncbi:YfcE family phosphodiesterase [Ornithinibacillus sp. L9]|uniref:Phosphoesterase n=1 Tax=Ornithinibacillus caprae TaxID=2678566 RepID=A0A6N8FFX4_9BACI|nr:metallophosphoesterase [Ornithinibacillus caprae]MUK86947.1 YfcE family phosphodiesterase [Ornithinibacillus caprae]
MNRVLLVSDSHGLTNELEKIKSRHDCTYMFHCGDSELEIDKPELEGFIKVAGNCDFDPRYPEEQVTDIGNLRFFVTHGHLHQVKMNMMTISYRAEELGTNVVCFGHTHIAGAEKIGKQLFINPGSIRLPRNRVERTYAIVEWETISDIKVDFYTVEGELVPDMSYKTSLTE